MAETNATEVEVAEIDISEARHTLDVGNEEINTPSCEHPDPASLIPMNPVVDLLRTFRTIAGHHKVVQFVFGNSLLSTRSLLGQHQGNQQLQIRFRQVWTLLLQIKRHGHCVRPFRYKH